MDLKNKKILYELDKDSRQSNKQIAKKVRLSEQVIGNRIKNLIDNKVIEYFYVKTNPSLLNYIHVKIYLRLHNITEQKELELINELNIKDKIFWLASLRGKYDIEISIYIKNISEFSKVYEEIFSKYGDYILERNIVILEKASTYTKAHLVPNYKPEEIVYTKTSDSNIELDDTDSNLLKILNKGGRKPLIEIARDLNLSPDTVKYRINNLKNKGVITGFGVKIDFNKLNNNYNIITFKLQNMNKEKYSKFEALSKLNKNAIIFMKTIGDHDIELEVETSNKEELDKLMKSIRDNFITEIKDYEILEVTREHRMTYYPF